MVNPLFFLIIGFGEWFVASERTWLISQGKARKAAIAVFVENLLSFFVMFQIVRNVDNWWLALAYSLGASLGTFLNLKVEI